MGCGASVDAVPGLAPRDPGPGREFFIEVFLPRCRGLDPEGVGALQPDVFWEAMVGRESPLNLSPDEAAALRLSVNLQGAEVAYEPALPEVYRQLLLLYQVRFKRSGVPWSLSCSSSFYVAAQGH